jgi:pimeloyl-ACP methyl ester carboxylesterase
LIPLLLLILVLGWFGVQALQSRRLDAYLTEQPIPYYFESAPAAAEAVSLLVALHGEDGDAQDCFAFWRPAAEALGFALLCPQLRVPNQAFDFVEAERRLSLALNEAYRRQALDDRFFLVGFEAGADLALSYTWRYPEAIAGVSAITPEFFPTTILEQRTTPLLVIIPEENYPARDNADTFTQSLADAGLPARLVRVPGSSASYSRNAGNITLDFLDRQSQ